MSNPKKKKKAKVVSNRVKEHLDKIGMSQQELADLCETNKGHISNIINKSRKHISLATAMKISKVLNQPIEQLFTLEENGGKN